MGSVGKTKGERKALVIMKKEGGDISKKGVRKCEIGANDSFFATVAGGKIGGTWKAECIWEIGDRDE